MSTPFSPGPWRVVADGEAPPAADHIADATGEPIAVVADCIKPTNEHEANARLLAASWDLWTALTRLVVDLDEVGIECDALEAARSLLDRVEEGQP